MDKNILEIDKLSVTYRKGLGLAIENVGFGLKTGSITALIGPNGSGKSSVIKAILGLVEYKGSIKFLGQKVSENYSLIGYVPQRFGFDTNFPISVREFVGLALVGCNDDRETKMKNIHRVLKLVGVRDLSESLIGELSGGQLQRVLLARALVHKPKLLLLDEPEAGVDAQGEQNFYKLLESLVVDKDLTVLIASHELDIVYAYADEVVCVNRVMVCKGTPKEVLKKDTFESLYGKGFRLYGHHH